MTKKEQQRIAQERINRRVETVIDVFNEFCFLDLINCPAKRLRYCSAKVYETEHFFVLQSYSTLVAIIDKENDTLYDFLRYVYGYTSTSAQHIAKFNHDYGAGKRGCSARYTWRAC